MIDNFLGSLYEASYDGSPDSWVTAYSKLAKLLACGPGFMGIYCASTDRYHYVASTFSSETMLEYQQFFRHIDPMRPRIIRLGEGGQFRRVRDCPDNDFLE